MNLIFHQTFDKPLRKYPYYDGSSLIFSYEEVDIENETGQWGVAILNLDNGEVERHPSPFKVKGNNIYPEDISWSLNGLINGFFVFVLSWETSYDQVYQFVKWDRENWYLFEKNELDNVTLSKHSSFKILGDIEIINNDDFCIGGGAIHPYKTADTLNIAIDGSHAFEHDNSPTIVKESYEHIKANHPAYHSNLELIELIEYKKTAELPDAVPMGHPARNKKHVWDIEVAQYRDMFFIFFDSFRQRGILDILIFKE